VGVGDQRGAQVGQRRQVRQLRQQRATQSGVLLPLVDRVERDLVQGRDRPACHGLPLEQLIGAVSLQDTHAEHQRQHQDQQDRACDAGERSFEHLCLGGWDAGHVSDRRGRVAA
jgi:hypothetical protein